MTHEKASCTARVRHNTRPVLPGSGKPALHTLSRRNFAMDFSGILHKIHRESGSFRWMGDLSQQCASRNRVLECSQGARDLYTWNGGVSTWPAHAMHTWGRLSNAVGFHLQGYQLGTPLEQSMHPASPIATDCHRYVRRAHGRDSRIVQPRSFETHRRTLKNRCKGCMSHAWCRNSTSDPNLLNASTSGACKMYK